MSPPESEGWDILGEDFGAGSDHPVNSWSWDGDKAKPDRGWKIRGWPQEKLDKEKEEEREPGRERPHIRFN